MLPTEFSWMKSHPLKLIKYLKDLLVALKKEIIIKVFPIFFFIGFKGWYLQDVVCVPE